MSQKIFGFWKQEISWVDFSNAIAERWKMINKKLSTNEKNDTPYYI